MKSKKNHKLGDRLSEICEKEYFGKKMGLLISVLFSIVTVLLTLPFVKWINIFQAKTLYSGMGLSEEAISKLESNYSVFNILSFVEHTKQGGIGLYGMIIFLLAAITVYFNLALLFKLIRSNKKSKNKLNLYFLAKTSMLCNIITTLATIGYMVFANMKLGMRVFSLSPIVYFILIISFIGYISITIVEAKERLICREYGFLHELKKNWVLFLMLVPTIIYLLINNYLPMIGIYYAFTSFNFRDGLWASPYVGFKNFEHLFRADLLNLTKNTILYNFIFIAVGNVLQIIFAIFISQVSVKWFKKTTQTLMFMPYFVSFVILKVLVYNLFEYDAGVINNLLTSMGLDKVDFYNKPSYWPALITIFYLWKNLGYGMVVYLATILGISAEYYEAAKVDGANIIQQIRYITLPLIKPTFIILFLFSLGNIMKGQFELFYQLVGTNGILFNATDIFDTYVYRITTTQPLNIGIGTAAGLYQSLFGFGVILITNYLVKRKNSEYALF